MTVPQEKNGEIPRSLLRGYSKTYFFDAFNQFDRINILCKNALIEKYKVSNKYYIPKIENSFSREYRYQFSKKVSFPSLFIETNIIEIYELNRSLYMVKLMLPELDSLKIFETTKENIEKILSGH